MEMIGYQIYTTTNIKPIGTFKTPDISDTLFMSENEIESGNSIVGVSLSPVNKNIIKIQLCKNPQNIVYDKKYRELWVGIPSGLKPDEYEILWPIQSIDKEVAYIATEIGQVYDDFRKVGA
ncbi:MAG: hypothetical protein WC389_13920 [Lutibacter sp.]|jgi:hypothetical protein